MCNIGSFSYQFLTIGTYYYWSTPVDSSGLISLRGVITVVTAQPQTLTVQVTSGSFTGNSFCQLVFFYKTISFFSFAQLNHAYFHSLIMESVIQRVQQLTILNRGVLRRPPTLANDSIVLQLVSRLHLISFIIPHLSSL